MLVVNLIGVLKYFFSMFMEIRNLKRRLGVLVGFELIEEDSVVFIIRDIFSEVFNFVIC